MPVMKLESIRPDATETPGLHSVADAAVLLALGPNDPSN
jgi:hypothetical protein